MGAAPVGRGGCVKLGGRPSAPAEATERVAPEGPGNQGGAPRGPRACAQAQAGQWPLGPLGVRLDPDAPAGVILVYLLTKPSRSMTL
jgi:hypothetical protein